MFHVDTIFNNGNIKAGTVRCHINVFPLFITVCETSGHRVEMIQLENHCIRHMCLWIACVLFSQSVGPQFDEHATWSLVLTRYKHGGYSGNVSFLLNYLQKLVSG